MKKIFRIAYFILIILIVFIIYLFRNDKVRVVSFSDNLEYIELIKEELNMNNKLKNYTKYIKKDLTLNDVKYILKENNIKRELRESNLVTLELGKKDYYNYTNNKIDDINYKEIINNILIDYELVIKEIKKYAKEKILIIGFYNDYNLNNNYDLIYAYFDSKLRSLASKYNIEYLSLYSIFKDKNLFDYPKDYYNKTISNIILRYYLHIY